MKTIENKAHERICRKDLTVSADEIRHGIVVFTFLLGFISTYLFTKTLNRKRIIDIQIMALMFATIIFSIRGIYTDGVFFWFLIVAIVAQWVMLKHKRAIYLIEAQLHQKVELHQKGVRL